MSADQTEGDAKAEQGWLFPGARPSRTILASRCLSGVPCRYHGRPDRRYKTKVATIAAEHGAEVVWCCPEQEGGLPTPRPAVRRRRGRYVERESGRDVTAAFERGAVAAVEQARQHRVVLCVMLAKSPSCDPDYGCAGKALRAAGFPCMALGDTRGRPGLRQPTTRSTRPRR